jgi:hypothetical protein
MAWQGSFQVTTGVGGIGGGKARRGGRLEQRARFTMLKEGTERLK